jgi:hypothetical protein
LVLSATGVIGVLAAAVVTGATAPLVLSDPGPLVRWGLPLATVTAHMSSAVTLGLLVLAAFLMPETTRTNRRVEATRLAAVSAFVWAAASGVSLLFTFADLAGLPLTDPALLPQLGAYVFSLDTTRILAISSALAMVVAVWGALAR